MEHRGYDTEIPAYDELRLRQLTVDEALPLLDTFLHDRFRAGLHTVRIIHGKGTGVIRETVQRELKHHPLVKSFRPADSWEGGYGVTVVTFTDR